MLDKKMITEDRNVLLFLDNAPCHPDTLQNGLKNIKLEYFPKNTTSRLQPCDAGIIRSFKQKYRKRLVRFIVARIDMGDQSASKIIEDVTILKVISWIQASWAEVTEDTIKHCFEKCGFGKPDVVAEDTLDDEFNELLRELCPDVTVDEFVEFDDSVDTCEPAVNLQSIDWREELRFISIQSVLQPHTEEAVETVSDSDEDGPDDVMEVDGEPVVTSKEALEMLDKLLVFMESNDADTEDLRCVSSLTKKVEQLRLCSKKQKTINDFFGSA